MSLMTEYRPQAFKDMVGQKEIRASLLSMFKSKKPIPHAFLFSGPSGTGKTTLARIIANKVKGQIIEIDAAVFSGVDAMRTMLDGLRYRAMGESGNKIVILDECHAASKAAWQSLLKAIEEPPPHVYFCLCTTEVDKVPKTIKTRVVAYDLKPVSKVEIEELLETVADRAGLTVADGILSFLALKAEGSPRLALSLLEKCHSAKNQKEARALVDEGVAEHVAVDLFRLLVGGKGTWQSVQKLMRELEVPSYESLRIGLVNYAAAVAANDGRSQSVERALQVIDCFSRPLNKSTEKAEFYLGLGELLLG